METFPDGRFIDIVTETSIFANLAIKPDQTEKVSPSEGPDWTDNDPTYLRNAQISK
jgi:hypothetical protein